MAERGRGELRIDPEDRAPRGDAPEERRKPRRRGGGGRRGGGWGGRLVRWGLLLALWGMILGGGAIGWFWLTLPPTNDLTQSERRPSVTLLGADGGSSPPWRPLRRAAEDQGSAALPAARR